MKVIEFAEHRLADEDNSASETRYWAAYLDGAKAQKKEDERLTVQTKGEENI